MPYTFGDSQIAVDVVDLAVEVDFELAAAHSALSMTASRVIVERIAAMIESGATLPAGHRGGAGLHVAGSDRPARAAGLDRDVLRRAPGPRGCARIPDEDYPITASFCFGSPRLYEWVDGNPRVRMLRTEKTNSPALIAANRAMTSVNAALEVDLFGQANASRINARIHSG